MLLVTAEDGSLTAMIPKTRPLLKSMFEPSVSAHLEFTLFSPAKLLRSVLGNHSFSVPEATALNCSSSFLSTSCRPGDDICEVGFLGLVLADPGPRG